MNARHRGIAGILAVAVALGAVREFLFLNLNYQIDFVRHGRDVSYAHSLFQGWAEGMGLDGLLLLKWVLAIVLAGCMLALSILLARVLWNGHRYRTAIITAFLLIGAIALSCHLMAATAPGLGAVSVKLLHALQYPVILFFLWAASMLERPARR